MRLNRFLFSFVAACGFSATTAHAATPSSSGAPRLWLRDPAMSRRQIVFTYARHLWTVSRDGGTARPLTGGTGEERDPCFSPDGSQIAFTGEYHGNADVFVIPAAGGTARRLTYHPGPDEALGWTPDGKRVLFRSGRSCMAPRYRTFFTVDAEGGLETDLPLPMGNEGSFSPDGAQLAYVPLERVIDYFKHYRGGRAPHIWVTRLSDARITPIPHQNTNDFNPMWIGRKIYFLSDRNGPVTLFAYDVPSRRVVRVLANHGPDLASAAAGPGAIVYAQLGSLYVYDLTSGRTRPVPMRIDADFPELHSHTVQVTSVLQHARLSPAGDQVAFEARGEILVVHARTGAARNLTHSPGIMERDPAWAPDGRTIAYFSDELGEYALHLRPVDNDRPVEKINLGEPPSFYYSPCWSPDGTKIAYTDRRRNLWYIDRSVRKPVKVDTDRFSTWFGDFSPVWSPDSHWLAYSRRLQNRQGAIFLYSLHTGARTPITDGMSDATQPAFDRSGDYLYFTASTDAAVQRSGSMQSFARPRSVSKTVYLVLLRRGLASPFLPAGNTEGELSQTVSAERQPTGEETRPGNAMLQRNRIDPEGVSGRIVPLPLPARDYVGLIAGPAGSLLLLEDPSGQDLGFSPWSVRQFDLQASALQPLVEGISALDVSADGRHIIYRLGERWTISSTSAPPEAGGETLPTEGLTVRVEPRAEWQQMYREAWRIVRDFFYDPGLHGLDLKAAEARYAPFVAGLASRADLNSLFEAMLAELTASHISVYGGDEGEAAPGPGGLLEAGAAAAPGGLLGADYRIANGHYQFARIYPADPWDAEMKAPLTQPGATVRSGEYLLAINGQKLTAADNVQRLLEGTAGKATVIRVGPDPGGAGARDVTVIPIEDELGLRQWAWQETNRQQVNRLTHGRVGYMFLPDTLFAGYARFNRDYYALLDKEAIIVDARFNEGGFFPDYMIERMSQPVLDWRLPRDGDEVAEPAVIRGPKVLIANEYTVSGGDALAWYFRLQQLGPIVGKRTFGGLASSYGPPAVGLPELMDGGVISIPTTGVWGPSGQWEVENHGVAPDAEVELDPEQVRRGHDPQLEKAIQTALARLGRNPVRRPRRPADPRYGQAP